MGVFGLVKESAEEAGDMPQFDEVMWNLKEGEDEWTLDWVWVCWGVN